MQSDFSPYEKRLYVGIESGRPLNSLVDGIYAEVVAAAGAKILSAVSGDKGRAYLLSESSLFVFGDEIVFVTCGGASPIAGLVSLCQQLGEFVVKRLLFMQHKGLTHNLELTRDSEILGRLGMERSEIVVEETPEQIGLIYRAAGAQVSQDRLLVEFLNQVPKDCERSLSKIFRQEFAEFALDEHFFSPGGYSLNGIKGDCYLSVHLSPDPVGYGSIEIRAESKEKGEELMRRVMGRLEGLVPGESTKRP